MTVIIAHPLAEGLDKQKSAVLSISKEMARMQVSSTAVSSLMHRTSRKNRLKLGGNQIEKKGDGIRGGRSYL